MAVTAQKSTQLANADAVPVVRNNAVDVTGKLRIAYFDFTQAGAGDINSTVDLVKLPPGRVRVIHTSGKVRFSAFGASRTLDIGYASYTKNDGTTQSGSTTAFASAVDVSSAGNLTLDEAGHAASTTLFQSRDGVVVQAKVAGGTIPDGATLSGVVIFAMDA